MAIFTIHIKELQALTILGVYEWEKQAQRLVTLNLIIVLDNDAGNSDNISDTVDYAMLEERIIRHLERMSYNLLERLAADIAELILALDPHIQQVSVEADKPGALRQARSVSVSTTLTKKR